MISLYMNMADLQRHNVHDSGCYVRSVNLIIPTDHNYQRLQIVYVWVVVYQINRKYLNKTYCERTFQ